MRSHSPLTASLVALLAACDAPSPAVTADATVADISDVADVTDATIDSAPSPDAATFRCARTRPAPVAMPTRCNGAPQLCARRYDRVAYATTHNAFSTAEENFMLPNQQRALARQLRDGVRGLMLDVHDDRGTTSLCHGLCVIGHRPLREGLCDIGRFLDEDPTAVVSIIFESYVPVADIEVAFREAQLLDDVHAQPAGTPWPTLAEMIRAGRRLVVFSDRDGGARPWHHDVWQWAQENPYAARTPDELSCRLNRGDARNSLFILNNFLTNPTASPSLADMVNHDPFLTTQVQRCQRERMLFPNFVTVDFYDRGDVLRVVDALNAP